MRIGGWLFPRVPGEGGRVAVVEVEAGSLEHGFLLCFHRRHLVLVLDVWKKVFDHSTCLSSGKITKKEEFRGRKRL